MGHETFGKKVRRNEVRDEDKSKKDILTMISRKIKKGEVNRLATEVIINTVQR